MSCNCNSGCDCESDPCFENDAAACGHDPILKSNPNGKTIAVVCSDYTVDKGIDQVDVTRTGVTITLPTKPQPGDEIEITAPIDVVSVTDGTREWSIPQLQVRTWVYTSACKWVADLAIDG